MQPEKMRNHTRKTHPFGPFIPGFLLAICVAMFGCGAEEDTPCANDLDCARGSICQGGICSVIDCEVELDCPGRNRTCIPGEGICTAYECAADSECDNGICQQHLCIEVTSCQDRCNCEGWQVCDGETYSCVAAPNSCDGDVDCPCGQICDRSTHGCGAGCRSDGDCDLGTYCDGSQCRDGCRQDSCENGLVCNLESHQCESVSALAPCRPCESHDDCGGPDDQCTTLASGSRHCTVACHGEDDCADGYSCVPLSEQSSQCLPIDNECKPCQVNGCTDGLWCNPNSGECNGITATCQPCQYDSQCGPGAICAWLGRQLSYCVPLCESNECPAGYHCLSEGTSEPYCVPAAGECQVCTDVICSAPTPNIEPQSCTCVSCLYDYHCTSGQLCSNEFHSCFYSTTRCNTASECGGLLCIGGLCVECQSQLDCSGQGALCVQGRCSTCECEPGYHCNHQGTCIPDTTGCTNDFDCSYGYRCVQGQCVPDSTGCARDTDCGQNERCVGGQCVPDTTGCTYDYDCYYGYHCDAGVCVPDEGFCFSDYDCDPGYRCNLQNVCVSDTATPCESDYDCDLGYTCNERGLCEERCLSDYDCDPGYRCTFDGQCVERTNNDCDSDFDCISGSTWGACDFETATCYTPGLCGTSDPFNSECPAGTTCQQVSGGVMSCVGCDPWDIYSCRILEDCEQGICRDWAE